MHTHLVNSVCDRPSLASPNSLILGPHTVMFVSVGVDDLWSSVWHTDGSRTCFACFKTSTWQLKTINYRRQILKHADCRAVTQKSHHSRLETGYMAWTMSAFLTTRVLVLHPGDGGSCPVWMEDFFLNLLRTKLIRLIRLFDRFNIFKIG